VRRACSRLASALLVAVVLLGVATAEAMTPGPITPLPRVPEYSPRALTLAVSGDVLPHTQIWRAAQQWGRGSGQPFDFRPMFSNIAPVVTAADLAICHLETPIAPAGEALSTFPRYGVPAQIVDAVAAAGYDRCSTASNHSLDRGVAGIEATLANLDRVGLGHSGTARSPAEAALHLFAVNGVAIAHLSYTFSFNGLRLPADEAWRANLIDVDRILADAHAARVAGAELVLVSLHWGNEYSAVVTGYQRTIAERLTASGDVDLIIGHHAHVVQPIEAVNGRWVLFGLGNHLSNMTGGGQLPAATQDGIVVTVRFFERAPGRFLADQPVAHPTWVEPTWKVIMDVSRTLAQPDIPASYRRMLTASLARTKAVVGPFVG
jgi:poly-gamma-glutamate synthesis protein (capsule biosynthesis protein)